MLATRESGQPPPGVRNRCVRGSRRAGRLPPSVSLPTLCARLIGPGGRRRSDPRQSSIVVGRAERGLAYPGQGPTRGDSSTDSGMLPLQGPLNRPGGRLWREHGRLEQRQAPAGAGAWPGALAAGSWPLASGSARCACSSQPQAVCFGQQAGRHDALRRAEGELPGCGRRAAPADPPGPSAAPDPRAEADRIDEACCILDDVRRGKRVIERFT